ncbi:MAG TPA: glycosyltransferase [Blastocatellia bacterium]|nr:glycosyltransferase [Blastocatellia bacterium]
MRLTIVGPAFPLRGGIAHHVYWLKRELIVRGHAVQVVSFRRLYPAILFPGKTTTDTSQLKLDAGAEPILDPLNPVTWIRAARAIRGFNPDAALVQWWNPLFAPLSGTLIRLLKRRGIACIVECHNVLPHERSPLDRPLLRYAFSPVSRFITHSKADREELLNTFGEKDVTVASLPALGEFSSRGDKVRGGHTMLFFGIVRKYKGLDVLLRAMPKVLSEIECDLMIAGEFYDSVEKYRELISSLGLERHVRIDNRYVPNEEVPALFKRADVLVLPYLSATQSGVAGIAQANALPIIASSAGGLAEVVEEKVSGLLFPPGDSDALAERIVYFFKENLGPAFGANMRSGAGKTAGNNLADVLEGMLAPRS